jgi:hypothetical protein
MIVWPEQARHQAAHSRRVDPSKHTLHIRFRQPGRRIASEGWHATRWEISIVRRQPLPRAPLLNLRRNLPLI